MHERYRQTTDGRAIAHSKREREFTFAKKSARKHRVQNDKQHPD